MFCILYRSQTTGKIHPVVSDNAYGIREFASQDDAKDYLTKLPDDTTSQIVPLEID